MTVAIDFDNILCNLQEVVTNLFNERYGTSYTLNDFTSYDVMNVLPTDYAIKMQAMYGESGLYDLVKPISGSQNGLQKLVNTGHQVYIVTDAIPDTFGEKVRWLKRYYPFIPDSNIVSMKHKHLFKCDIMIEDNLDNLLAGHHYERICLDYPWNRRVSDYVYGIYRCNNWNEIVAAVNKICEEE